MENKYKLSICIPTLNRWKELKILLDSIVNQEHFNDDVSIVINDWPSKDNTETLVTEYQKIYSNIFYSRNEKAVWMLPAILESIDMSNWEYTWIFGSDDFMHKDALKIIINILKTSHPKIILSNRQTFKNNDELIQNTINDELIHHFNWFSNFSKYIWNTNELTFDDKHAFFTFMSAFCFNTEYYKKNYKYTIENLYTLDKLKKHYFHYIFILFSELSDTDIVTTIISPKLVFCKVDSNSWNHNKKIVADIRMLGVYLNSKYNNSYAFVKLFNKFVREWWKFWYLFPLIRNVLKKIWVYDLFSYLWRKYILKNINK